MATLSRDASAARLLLDLTALSVKEPTRDRIGSRIVYAMIRASPCNLFVVCVYVRGMCICVYVRGMCICAPRWKTKPLISRHYR